MANKTIKIDVKKTTQDFEIGSKTYTMDFSDEKLKQYGEYINSITTAIDETEDEDPLADLNGKFEKVNTELKKFTDIAFGEDAYDSLYEEVGRSTVNLSSVIVQVIEVAQEEMDLFKEARQREEKTAYYASQSKKSKK